MSDFSKSIHQLRLNKKQSQRKVSQELGISQALLSHYENGVRQPKLAFVRKIAGYYGVSSDDLLGCEPTDARVPSESETELLSGASQLVVFAETVGGAEAAKAAAQYISAAIENARAILQDPNAAYNPQLYIDIKTAEAALYNAIRGEEQR